MRRKIMKKVFVTCGFLFVVNVFFRVFSVSVLCKSWDAEITEDYIMSRLVSRK